jgi:integrase
MQFTYENQAGIRKRAKIPLSIQHRREEIEAAISGYVRAQADTNTELAELYEQILYIIAKPMIRGLANHLGLKRGVSGLAIPLTEALENYHAQLDAAARTDKAKRRRRQALKRCIDTLELRHPHELTKESAAKLRKVLDANNFGFETQWFHWAKLIAFCSYWCDVNGITRKHHRILSKRDFRNVTTGSRLIRRTLSQDELRKLFEAARYSTKRYGFMTGRRRALAYELLLYSGFRPSELARTRIDDYMLDNGNPRIRCKAHNSKTGYERTVPIPAHFAEALKGYLDELEYPADRPIWRGIATCGSDELIDHDLAAAGIPKETSDGRATLYSLRYTFISNLLHAGVDPQTVRELAGHRSLEMTLNVYARQRDDQRRAAVEKLEAIWEVHPETKMQEQA